jgi:NADH-quinone oxidoreductase subunit N
LFALKIYAKILKLYSFEIYFLLGTSILGLFFLFSSSDFINMYLSIELYSLSIYCVMAHFKKKLVSIEAAFKYFVIGSISSSLLLLSISSLYAIFGTFNYYELEILLYFNTLEPYNHYLFSVLSYFFISLLIISLLIKLGAAPFHL